MVLCACGGPSCVGSAACAACIYTQQDNGRRGHLGERRKRCATRRHVGSSAQRATDDTWRHVRFSVQRAQHDEPWRASCGMTRGVRRARHHVVNNVAYATYSCAIRLALHASATAADAPQHCGYHCSGSRCVRGRRGPCARQASARAVPLCHACHRTQSRRARVLVWTRARVLGRTHASWRAYRWHTTT